MVTERFTADERKQSIVQAAMPLFASRGFDGTTTRMIAEAAGVSEALLYRHFPSKESLYQEIQSHCARCVDEALDRLKQTEASTAALVMLVYYMMNRIVFGPDPEVDGRILHRIMCRSMSEDGDFARIFLQNRVNAMMAKMRECQEAAIKAGDMNPDGLSGLTRGWFCHHLAAMIALVHLPSRAVIDYKVKKEELVEQAILFALRGMGLTEKAIRTHYNPKTMKLLSEQSR